MITVSVPTDSDDMVVNRARRRMAAMTSFRWMTLSYGVVFLAVAAYCTIIAIRKLDVLDAHQLTLGFVYGVALGTAWMSFGILGGLCIGKALAGWQKQFRETELLVRYHARLLELGELKPANANAEKNG